MDIKEYAFNKTNEFESYDSYDYKRYFKNEGIIAACAYVGGNLLGFDLVSTAGLLLGADALVRLFRGGLNTPVSGLVGKVRELTSK